MAEMDKPLPNVTEKVHVESPEEIEIEETKKLQEVNDEGVEIIQNEDGSADVDFEPGKVNPSGGEDHFENLADLLPEEVINRLASELYQNYEDYKTDNSIITTYKFTENLNNVPRSPQVGHRSISFRIYV